jgi:dihydrofolate synthase/folylpolyglutamate synthase
MVIFQATDADRLVLEIGLGGRLDAVNAVEPDGAVITNVSLEHCDWLGDTVEAIAVEKAGVMRPGKPVVFGSSTVPETISSEAERIGADLRLPGRDYSYESVGASAWRWQGRQVTLEDLNLPSLRGAFQLQNASAVLALVESLKLDSLLGKALVDSAFSRLEIPGRLQRISARHEWLLDVAHNPDAARVLGEWLAQVPKPAGVTALVGMLSDKDVAGIVSPLEPHVDRWVAITAAHARARPARALAQAIAQLTGKPCLVEDDIAAALGRLDETAGREELLLVTGSFYAVGPALAWLTRERMT